LEKDGEFDEIIEIKSGDLFRNEYCDKYTLKDASDLPSLVLMDINMPGRDGFETAFEVQQRIDSGNGSQNLIVMMFTSSDNVRDKEKIKEIDIIKGYITKPMDMEKVRYIRDLYLSFL